MSLTRPTRTSGLWLPSFELLRSVVRRQFTVLIDGPSRAGGIPDPAYPVGIFEVAVEPDSDPKLVAIIADADLEG